MFACGVALILPLHFGVWVFWRGTPAFVFVFYNMVVGWNSLSCHPGFSSGYNSFSCFANPWRDIGWVPTLVILGSHEMSIKFPVPKVPSGKGKRRGRGFNFQRILSL